LEFEADPDYKFLRGLLVSALEKQNSNYDFWYDWVAEQPNITDRVAIERYINNNTDFSLEIKIDKKENETPSDENEKENTLSKYNSIRTSASNNEDSKNISEISNNAHSIGNITNDSIEKNNESDDKKHNKKKDKEKFRKKKLKNAKYANNVVLIL